MTSTTTDTTTPRPRRACCPQCGAWHKAADAHAIGHFSLTAPLYRAASAPVAGLRATRAQAIDDECAARRARNAAPAPQNTPQPVSARRDAAPWIAPDGLTLQVHHGDGTTTTAPVVALIDRDEVAATVRVQTLPTTPGQGLAIVRRTRQDLDGHTRTTVHVEPHSPAHEGPGPWTARGTTVTGHEPVTGITGPLGLLIPRR